MTFMEIPFDASRAKSAARNQSFDDPGPLPEKLMHVPGFIDELADWTMSTSPSPNRVLAFAGALSMLAHLSGRSFTDEHGTHTNLYLIVLGESGIGKDAPRKTNSRLAACERYPWPKAFDTLRVRGLYPQPKSLLCPAYEALTLSIRGAYPEGGKPLG